MKTILKEISKIKILDPKYGDFKLNVYPFNHKHELILPRGFELWQEQVNNIIKYIPYQKKAEQHYLTIDSKFCTEDEFQRREGIHIDGNFCVDPVFQLRTWGGSTWSGTTIDDGKIIQAFASPYDIQMPIGQYVSENKGGLICASSFSGCEAWAGNIENVVGDGGSYPEEYLLHVDREILSANTLYFMNSNCPHRTLLIPNGTRRTLIRITLNHNYDNDFFFVNENFNELIAA